MRINKTAIRAALPGPRPYAAPAPSGAHAQRLRVTDMPGRIALMRTRAYGTGRTTVSSSMFALICPARLASLDLHIIEHAGDQAKDMAQPTECRESNVSSRLFLHNTACAPVYMLPTSSARPVLGATSASYASAEARMAAASSARST